MWSTNLTMTIDDELGDKWSQCLEDSYAYYGNPGGLKKNPLSIARALNSAWDDNIKSNSLIKLISSIMSFAKKENNS